jgi:hypothetical protein
MHFILRRCRSIGLLVVLLFATLTPLAGASPWPDLSTVGAPALFPEQTLGQQIEAVTAPVRARREVEHAWQKVREAGAYQFSADVIQHTIPLVKITNVGQRSRQSQFHIQGETSLPAQELHMVLWSHGGSLLDRESGTEIQVNQEQARVRQGNGPWEEVDNFTGIFAPEGDFLTYLVAARNIRRHDPGQDAAADSLFPVANLEITRYRYDVDGPFFARYLRDQIQQQMLAKGELPHGINLELPTHYTEMKGDGEIWINAHGYPVRQIVQLAFPPAEGQDYQVTAEIRVSFSGFPVEPPLQLAASPIEGLMSVLAQFRPARSFH